MSKAKLPKALRKQIRFENLEIEAVMGVDAWHDGCKVTRVEIDPAVVECGACNDTGVCANGGECVNVRCPTLLNAPFVDLVVDLGSGEVDLA